MYGSPGYLGYGVADTRTTGEIMGAGWDAIFGNGTSDPSDPYVEYPESQPDSYVPKESSRDPLEISFLRSKKVRSTTDLVSVVVLVFDGVKAETGKWNSSKLAALKTQAANATTIPKKVAVLQELAAYAKNNKATQVKDAISQGVAYEFWKNVESPASGVPVKSGGSGKGSKDVNEMLKLPFYRERWFVPTVGIGTVAAIILLAWKPWK